MRTIAVFLGFLLAAQYPLAGISVGSGTAVEVAPVSVAPGPPVFADQALALHFLSERLPKASSVRRLKQLLLRGYSRTFAGTVESVGSVWLTTLALFAFFDRVSQAGDPTYITVVVGAFGGSILAFGLSRLLQTIRARTPSEWFALRRFSLAAGAVGLFIGAIIGSPVMANVLFLPLVSIAGLSIGYLIFYGTAVSRRTVDYHARIGKKEQPSRGRLWASLGVLAAGSGAGVWLYRRIYKSAFSQAPAEWTPPANIEPEGAPTPSQLIKDLRGLRSPTATYQTIVRETDRLAQGLLSLREPTAKEFREIAQFLLDPSPIASNSISARWAVAVLKERLIALYLRFKMSRDGVDLRPQVEELLTQLLHYTEIIAGEDPLMKKYFPNILPAAVLSEPVRVAAREKLTQSVEWTGVPQTDVFRWSCLTLGTPQDMEDDLQKIREAKTAKTIEIPIDDVAEILYLRRLDPGIKRNILESARAHTIPPELVLYAVRSAWRRDYLIGSKDALGNMVRRKRLTKAQAEWLETHLPERILNRSLGSDLMGFIGGPVLDAHSRNGLARLRPVWAKRYGGFDRFGWVTGRLSTRRIAWLLWNPRLNIEAVSCYLDGLREEAFQAAEKARRNVPFDTSPFSAETGRRNFTMGDYPGADDDRIPYLREVPMTGPFAADESSWLSIIFHPVEMEYLTRRDVMPLGSYLGERSGLLPSIVRIARSRVLEDSRDQAAVISGITRPDQVKSLGSLLNVADRFVAEAARRTLEQLQTDHSRPELQREANHLLQSVTTPGRPALGMGALLMNLFRTNPVLPRRRMFLPLSTLPNHPVRRETQAA